MKKDYSKISKQETEDFTTEDFTTEDFIEDEVKTINEEPTFDTVPEESTIEVSKPKREKIKVVKVCENVVNIRQSATRSSQIKGLVKRGELLKVIGGDLDSEWINVIYQDGKSGYIMSMFVEEA